MNLETLDRTVCWTPAGGAGMEHLQLRAEKGGYVARSIVLGIDDETPFRLQYKIKADQDWRTRKLWVRAATPLGESALALRSDGHGNWRTEDGTSVMPTPAATKPSAVCNARTSKPTLAVSPSLR